MLEKLILPSVTEMILFIIIITSTSLLIIGSYNIYAFFIFSASCCCAISSGLKSMENIKNKTKIEESFKNFWFRALMFCKMFLLVMSTYSIFNIYITSGNLFILDKENYNLISSIVSIIIIVPSFFWIGDLIDLKTPSFSFYLIEQIKGTIIVLFVMALFLFVFGFLSSKIADQKHLSIIASIISTLMIGDIIKKIFKDNKKLTFIENIKRSIFILCPYFLLCLVGLMMAKILFVIH